MGEGRRIRVLVADDHALIRQGVRHVLEETPDLEVVAEAATGEETLRLAAAETPDVVLLDISMPGMSGLEAADRLRHEAPDARVLILSMHEQTEYVLQAVRAGASGYLLKDAGPAKLREAVRAVNAGEGYFSPAVARELGAALRGEAGPAGRPGAAASLTPRERDVIVRIADGKSNKQIAADLGISRRTVESHRESLMRKLGIRTVAGLTRFVLENGLGETPPDGA
ncbi:MAG: response regulator [Gemmatimonadota bacterium]